MVRIARIALVVTLLAHAFAAQASGSESPAVPVDARDLVLKKGLKLDAAKLMNMRPGEQVDIEFPVIGLKTVTFEATTRGLDGRAYWHGRVGANPRDRVFLKQTATGFMGAVRFAGRQVAFEERGNGALAATKPPVPVAMVGRAFGLGAQLARGTFELRSNLAALAQAQPGSEMTLPLPDGETEVAIVTRSGVDEHGFQQIVGISRMDGVAAPVVLTISPVAVFGTIITQRGDYPIITRGGRTRILDPRAAGLVAPKGPDQLPAPPDLGSAAAGAKQPASEPPSAAILRRTMGSGGASSPKSTGTTPQQQLPPLPPNTVDTVLNLLLTYSSSYVSSWDTELGARTRLSNLVELANSAHANSGTGVQLRIVGWRQVDAPDDTPQAQLGRLRADQDWFEGVAAQKAEQGASFAVFFAPLNEATVATHTCGIAYVPAAYAAGLSAYYQQLPGLSVAALNDGQFGNQYCESLSLAHELGHLLGAVHDKENAPFMGVYPFSYGKGISGVFGTVMSYITPRVALFSSPQLKCSEFGDPCGSDSENVVATILRTKALAEALGQPTAVAASLDAGLAPIMVSGWLLQPDGTPFTGAVSLSATDARVKCQTGSTGLYTCSVPAQLRSITLKPVVAGRTVQPEVATFNVADPSVRPADPASAAAMVGRFYVH